MYILIFYKKILKNEAEWRIKCKVRDSECEVSLVRNFSPLFKILNVNFSILIYFRR